MAAMTSDSDWLWVSLTAIDPPDVPPGACGWGRDCGSMAGRLDGLLKARRSCRDCGARTPASPSIGIFPWGGPHQLSPLGPLRLAPADKPCISSGAPPTPPRNFVDRLKHAWSASEWYWFIGRLRRTAARPGTRRPRFRSGGFRRGVQATGGVLPCGASTPAGRTGRRPKACFSLSGIGYRWRQGS